MLRELIFCGTIGFLILSYLIKRQLLLVENTQNTKTVGNCLLYSKGTSIWNMQPIQDPILNRDNIAAYLGASRAECPIFIDKILQAAHRGPLSYGIVRTTLGLRRQLKFAVSSEVRTKGKALGEFFTDADAIVIYSLNESSVEQQPDLIERALTKPSSLLIHEMTHAFNDLYNKHTHQSFSSPQFCKEANQAFADAMTEIKKLEVLFNRYLTDSASLSYDEKEQIEKAVAIANQYKVPGLEHKESLFAFLHVINFVNRQLPMFTDDVILTNEIFAHLMHFIPEGLIKAHFPFFHLQLEKMVGHFDTHSMLPHDNQLPDAQVYDYTFLKTLNICSSPSVPDLVLDLKRTLDMRAAQVRGAFYHNRQNNLKSVLDYFDKNIMRCAINLLKQDEYTKVHLMIAYAHYGLGHHEDAYQHFNLAMKKMPEQFSDDDIEFFSRAAEAVNKPINNGGFKRKLKK